jgi:ABC-type polysaccharide/polyol phosphate transport system ATPase subunit
MGLSFAQAKRLAPGIAEFSDLGEYLDLPTRAYSTGILRLAFAISTAIEPDILIMDKMIAAGDLQFIEKAKRRLNRLIDRAQYSCPGLSRYGPDPEYCNKVAWLERGIIKQLGPPDVVTAAYSAASMRPDVGHG